MSTVTSVSRRHPFGTVSLDKNGLLIVDEYIVKMSAADTTAKLGALTASAGGVSIPALYTSYSSTITGFGRPLLRKKSVQQLQEESGLYFAVSCEYSNDDSTQTDSQQSYESPPWLRPQTVSYSHVSYEKALTQDFSDEPKPVLNSAGDPFDPPVAYSYVRPKITIRRSSSSFSTSSIALIGTSNSGNETIGGVPFGAGECRLLSYAAEKQYWEDPEDPGVLIPYYDETIEVETAGADETSIDEIEVADMGYRYLDENSKPVRASDQKGSEHVGVVRLDGEGGLISDPADPTEYKTFRVFKRESWAGLSLT